MSFQVNQSTDYDALFSYLEEKILKQHCEAMISFASLLGNDAMLRSCLQAFIDKYKVALDEVIYQITNHEVRFIPRSKVEDISEKKHYDALEGAYNSEYYLTDCGGYDTFHSSSGMILDSRLGTLLDLVDPREEDIILDVGCGRGELSYQLSKFAKKVVGIDYSQDAIQIAKETYAEAVKEERLCYYCMDILRSQDSVKYDKIILADVYEHIDAAVMVKLLDKLKNMMTEDGKLFIHTAPNLDWYDKVYPQHRQKALSECRYLPKNPRSYYEKLMHINEQSPQTLHETLSKKFNNVIVWDGMLSNVENFNDFKAAPRGNEIFAVASKSSLQSFKSHLFMHPVESGMLKFSLSLLMPTNSIPMGMAGMIPVRITNLSPIPVRSQNPYPVNLSYHILSKNRDMIIFDGNRTKLPKILYPNETVDCLLQVDGKLLERDKYILKISMVQEHVAWLEDSSIDCIVDVC